MKRFSSVKILLDSGMVKEVLSHKKGGDADVILLNDGKTYITLEEQDYYTFHDCSSSARLLRVEQSSDGWNRYLETYFPAPDLT